MFFLGKILISFSIVFSSAESLFENNNSSADEKPNASSVNEPMSKQTSKDLLFVFKILLSIFSYVPQFSSIKSSFILIFKSEMSYKYKTYSMSVTLAMTVGIVFKTFFGFEICFKRSLSETVLIFIFLYFLNSDRRLKSELLSL